MNDAQLARFKFAVLIGRGGGGPALRAGFHEAAGLAWQTQAVTHRTPDGRARVPRKLAGIDEVPEITLRRGAFADWQGLHEWLRDMRSGGRGSPCNVTIQLLDDGRPPRAVQEWKLSNARPVKYTAASLSATGTDVAIEELVLSSERIDIS